MNYSYRVKVLGYTADELARKGFSINATDCAPGELWVVGTGRTQLERDVHRHGLKTISQYEALRG